MLPGFEHITANITEDEKDIARLMVLGFKNRIGKDQSITSIEIIKSFKDNKGIGLTGPRVRKIINYIRNNFLPNLIGTSKGYYLSFNDDELKDWEDSLEGREQAIGALKINVRNYRKQLTTGKQAQINL